MDCDALAHWAHDIRNTLFNVTLHLELLGRRPKSDTRLVLDRSHALVKKAATMCSDLMAEAVGFDPERNRHRFDVAQTIEEVVQLLAPLAPVSMTLGRGQNGQAFVLANPKDVYRILFNLAHNAAGLARTDRAVKRIVLSVASNEQFVIVKIADDGPGLPSNIKATLFRRCHSAAGGTGYGLAIARELAERNGAFLDLSDTRGGTEFTLALPRADPGAPDLRPAAGFR